jgi:hypothetical protein
MDRIDTTLKMCGELVYISVWAKRPRREVSSVIAAAQCTSSGTDFVEDLWALRSRSSRYYAEMVRGPATARVEVADNDGRKISLFWLGSETPRSIARFRSDLRVTYGFATKNAMAIVNEAVSFGTPVVLVGVGSCTTEIPTVEPDPNDPQSLGRIRSLLRAIVNATAVRLGVEFGEVASFPDSCNAKWGGSALRGGADLP